MIKYGDLKYVLKPYLEIGMYDPKSGTSDEVLVVNFFVKDDEPIKDIITFFNYMSLDNFIDISTKNDINDEGYYIIFIEITNVKENIKDISRIIYDLMSISSTDEWTIKIFKQDKFKVNQKQVKDFLDDSK